MQACARPAIQLTTTAADIHLCCSRCPLPAVRCPPVCGPTPSAAQVCAGHVPGALCQHGCTAVECLLQLCHTPQSHRGIRALFRQAAAVSGSRQAAAEATRQAAAIRCTLPAARIQCHCMPAAAASVAQAPLFSFCNPAMGTQGAWLLCIELVG